MRPRRNATDLKPAPGNLRLFQAFLNTLHREAGTDELTSPRALAGWLVHHGLLAADVELGAKDLERARDVRQGWHALLAGSRDPKLLEALDRTLAPAMLRGRHRAGLEVWLEPATGGLEGALGRLLLSVARAQDDGTWRRLEVCASPACRAVFYDHSTNASARWCRPRCGNLISARASRRRRGKSKRAPRARPPRAQPPALSPQPVDPSLKKYYDLLEDNEG